MGSSKSIVVEGWDRWGNLEGEGRGGVIRERANVAKKQRSFNTLVQRV